MMHLSNRLRGALFAAVCGTILVIGGTGCNPQDSGAQGMASSDDALSVEVVHNEATDQVEVMVGGDLFTAYRYDTDVTGLKKPVLYPIRMPDGADITRGYPLEQRAGERADHPHHIGLWLNYGDVNGLDFWNNSTAVSEERAPEMGTIRHVSVGQTQGGEGEGSLTATAEWVNHEGEVLLTEETRYVIHAAEGMRAIDRITTLTAQQDVLFDDNKEGMLGLRLRRELEMPSERPVLLTDASGEPMEERVLDNTGVSGHYRNSEGVEGYPDVWGKRAKWMTLTGVVEGDSVTVAIFDHPNNVGYPTYWHARDYGLFAANPLGQEVFSEGAEVLDFSLDQGESTTFRHRILILDGAASASAVEQRFQSFASESL